MEERINWARLHTYHHSKRATSHKSTGYTDRKHTKIYETSKQSIKEYIDKLPTGDISMVKISKDLGIPINWVTEIVTYFYAKNKIQGLEVTRGTSGVRCFYKNNRTPKEFKSDNKMFRSTYKPKIDYEVQKQIKSMGL